MLPKPVPNKEALIFLTSLKLEMTSEPFGTGACEKEKTRERVTEQRLNQTWRLTSETSYTDVHFILHKSHCIFTECSGRFLFPFYKRGQRAAACQGRTASIH